MNIKLYTLVSINRTFRQLFKLRVCNLSLSFRRYLGKIRESELQLTFNGKTKIPLFLMYLM